EVRGTHSEYGEYAGQAWVHQGQVQRIVRWTHYRFQNKKVESIWNGTVTPTSMRFSLDLSNTLTSFEGFTPAAESFRFPTKVFVLRSPDPDDFYFEVKGEGSYTEKWHRWGEAPPTPFWQNLRRTVKGVGVQDGFAIGVARWGGIDKVIDWYRAHPKSQVYSERPEFKNREQYFIQDKTDADFYARNPEVLRVVDKTLNPLSLAEALMRRNAYAPPLQQKAAFFGHQTLVNNLNAAGLLEIAQVNPQGVKIGRYPDGDGALWTSMYGWAEVLRYQVTKDLEALVHFRRVLEGILTLVEITHDDKEFARTLAVSPAQESLGDGWVQGQGKYASLKWLRGGNNDMVKGVFLTLVLAHEVVGPNEVELRTRIQKVSKALLGMNAVAERDFNTGIAHGLVALWTQDEQELESFSNSILNFKSTLADLANIDAGFYVGGIADWSGVHLSMVSNLCQNLVSQELIKVFPYNQGGSLAVKTLNFAEEKLWEMQRNYRQAHRDFLTIVTYGFSSKAQKDALFKIEAQEALWTLREVPSPRKVGTATADLTLRPQWSLSAWPRLPWKALKGFKSLKENLDYDFFAQGAYSYPFFETSAWETNYLWISGPFDIKIKSQAALEYYSADYLMLYWVARASGLLTAEKY
ncbi:MAG: hypothetical protein ACXWRA_12775, partial [Pseudobdellovibrionaceae bacterium]